MAGSGRRDSGTKIRGYRHIRLKLMSSLHIKALLVTIRAAPNPAIIFKLIRIFKRKRKRTLRFQLLMSWLYNYLESVFLQEHICKNKQILKLYIRFESNHRPLALTDFWFHSKQKLTSKKELSVWFKIRIPLVLSQIHSKH